MDFAVIKIAGKQHLITPNLKLDVEGRLSDGEEELVFSDVLLFHHQDKIELGNPTVPNLAFKAKVLSTLKGEKIRVSKFKAKSRFRRVTGFRPFVTSLQFEDFSEKSTSPSISIKEVKKPKKTVK